LMSEQLPIKGWRVSRADLDGGAEHLDAPPHHTVVTRPAPESQHPFLAPARRKTRRRADRCALRSTVARRYAVALWVGVTFGAARSIAVRLAEARCVSPRSVSR